MRSKPEPLLCELHAHTRWSDGVLSMRDLVDLHGRLGYDVLCVTDHALRTDSDHARCHVHPDNYDAYLHELEEEGRRAWTRYRLLVIPGLELTYDDESPLRSAHVLTLGLREPIHVE